jgi:colicin import membrane protein
MTTPRRPATLPQSGPPPDDPYFYGFRYVRREGPDGSVLEQVPLTREDVLHPQEGDHVMQNDPHERWRRYLADVFAARLAGDPGVEVVSDLAIDWGVPGLRPLGPDIAVIPGVRARRPWATFDVTEEGARPALIVEITSPATADTDRAEKFEIYASVGVDQYVIVDAVRGRRFSPPRLVGYRRDPTEYREMTPDARGRLWLEPARLWLGVHEGEVVCYDEADRPLSDYSALTQELSAAEQRVMAADERAAAAEARLRALEEELRRLRG